MEQMFRYKLDDKGNAIITKYSGKQSVISVPAMLDGHPVTAIGCRAFESCKILQKITLPEGLATIEENAFLLCSNLISIQLPASLQYIGKRAFDCCEGLKEITLPYGLKHLGHGVFSQCDSLTEVHIPKTVTDLGLGVFKFCKSLEKVVLPPNITVVGVAMFSGCTKLEEIQLPDTVEIIDQFAFENCWKLRKINVPKRLRSIEYFAFAHCEALVGLKLPDTVTIGKEAFHDCRALHEAPETLPLPEYEINGVFYALQPDGTVHITGTNKKPHPWLTLNYHIHNHPVVKILPDAFAGCKELTEVNIQSGMKEIGSGAFRNCPKLRLIRIPASVNSIGKDAIPDIGKMLFEDEQAAHWADLQSDPWARKEYGLYDPIIVESKPGVVKVAPGSYAESFCRSNNILYTCEP